MTKKLYHIRYNTRSVNDFDRWRVICDDCVETLVSNIEITSKTYTTKDFMPDLNDFKYHISCNGYMTVKNNIAYISSHK